METKHSTSAFTTNHMASENVVGAIVVDHSSRQFSPVFQRFDFMLYLSVYDCYSALCLKVTKTRRTSVCTMSACLLAGRKRRQSLGGSSQSGVTQTQYSGLTAIVAWHCVSLVNTDDSRKTGSYYMSQSYNRYRYLFQN